MAKPFRIALLELGGSHDECLLSQLFALKSAGNQVFLITNPEIWERNQLFAGLVNDTMLVERSSVKKERFTTVTRTKKFLKKHKIDKLVCNTAQGSFIRDLALRSLLSRIQFIGIIHTTRKFNGSFTQSLINLKFKRYLLLSAYLLSKVHAKKLTVDYFYPLRFPDFEHTGAKDAEKIHIAIIGGVERRRKDLDGFLNMLQQVDCTRYQFTFLGKSDPTHADCIAFNKALAELGLEDVVVRYADFVEQSEFDRVLKQTDLILPLVHPDTPSADQYFRNQISGAMTVAFGYGIPMLIHRAYAHIEEMQTASFYYDERDFDEVLNSASKELHLKRKAMHERKSYSREFQEKRYVDFILG